MRQLQPDELLHALDLIARQKANAEMNHPLDQLEGQAARLLRASITEIARLEKLEDQALGVVDSLLRQNSLLRDVIDNGTGKNVIN